MADIKLDLAKMKHISSDDKSTTLMHPKGHQIKLAHNVLSPGNVAILKGMAGKEPNKEDFGKVIQKAEGGDVKPKVVPSHKRLDLYQKGLDSMKARQVPVDANKNKTADQFMRNIAGQPKKVEKFAKGGYTEGKAYTGMMGGGEASYAYDAGLPCLNPNCKSHGQPHPNCRCYSSAGHFAEGGEVSKLRYCAQGQPHMEGCEYANGGGISEQGKDVRYGNKESDPTQKDMAKHHAKEEAKGRAQFERMVKPKMRGLADGGNVSIGGIEVLGTGKASSQYKPDHGRNSDQDEAWPSPSQTSVGKANARPAPTESIYEPTTPPESDAKGGQVGRKMYAEGDEIAKDDNAPYKEGIDFGARKTPGELIGEAAHSFWTKQNSRPAEQPMGQLGREKQVAMDQSRAPAEDDSQAPDMPDASSNPDQQEPTALAQASPQAAPQPQASPQAASQAQSAPQGGQPQQAQANQLPAYNAPQQPQTPQQHAAQAYMQENQAFQQDLNNGHITPKTYNDLMFHNQDGSEKSTLGKIGAIFGLMVGGAGAGLAHQPNIALHMMDNVIKNDLDAQVKSKDNAQNFVKLEQARLLNDANVQHVLSSADVSKAEKDQIRQGIAMNAYTQGYMKMNSTAVHSIMSEISKMPDILPNGQPNLAKQQKVQMAMLMAKAADQKNAETAVMGAAGPGALNIYGVNNQSGAQAPNSEADFQNRNRMLKLQGKGDIAADNESKHIAGVPGQASSPDGVADARHMVQNANILNDKLQDVLNYAKANQGTMNPQKLKVAAQKAHELTAFYNQSVDNLGMTPGRLGWLDEQIKKNPTSWIQQLLGNNKVLQEIKDSANQRTNTRLNTLGYDVQPNKTHYSQQNQQSQPQYKIYNGVKYMRGPNGEPIPVK